MDTEKMGLAAKAAERILGVADTNTKNKALEAMAAALEANADKIISANEADLANGRTNGMKDSLLDRLRLTPERIAGMADGIRQVAALADPIGEIIEGSVRPNGIKIQRVRVPLGVVGVPGRDVVGEDVLRDGGGAGDLVRHEAAEKPRGPGLEDGGDARAHVAVEPLAVGVDRKGGEPGLLLADGVVERVVPDGAVEALLAAEMVVDGGDVGVRGAADVLDARLLVAAVGELPAGDAEEPFAGVSARGGGLSAGGGWHGGRTRSGSGAENRESGGKRQQKSAFRRRFGGVAEGARFW